jgi:hypothetical protein
VVLTPLSGGILLLQLASCMHCCSALLLLLLRGCCDENLSLSLSLAAAKTVCSYLETVDCSVKALHQAVNTTAVRCNTIWLATELIP